MGDFRRITEVEAASSQVAPAGTAELRPRSRAHRRRARLAAGGLLLLLAACERPPAAPDSIIIGVERDVGPLLPVVATSSLTEEINKQLYLALNSQRWVNGALEYVIDELSLAERWEFSADSTKLSYDLRPGISWSDGQPITAADVVFTYQVIRRPQVASPRVEFWENLDSVTAEGEHRVSFFFNRRHPAMLLHTGVGIIPAHVFAEHSADRTALIRHPSVADPGDRLVVSGPFRVADWRQGERLVLEANPRAGTAQARLRRVTFRVIPEEITRLAELRNGTLDAIFPAPMRAAKDLAEDPRFRIETISRRFYDYVAWNGARFEPFADAEVRRALSLGIDRPAILAAMGIADYAEPAGGPYPPLFRQLADPALVPDPYLPDSARAILHRRGWRDSDGDSVLDRAGRPFRFTLLTQTDNPRRTSTAQILQAQLAKIGVQMQIRFLEFNTLLDVMFEQRDFEAVLLGWQVGLEPDYLLGMFWPPEHPFNITGYADPALDSLVARAKAAETPDEAATYWKGLARVIARDRPYAFLWFFDELVALDRRVRNSRIDSYGVFQNLYEWSIEP